MSDSKIDQCNGVFTLPYTNTATDANGLQTHFVGVSVFVGVGKCEHSKKTLTVLCREHAPDAGGSLRPPSLCEGLALRRSRCEPREQTVRHELHLRGVEPAVPDDEAAGRGGS